MGKRRLSLNTGEKLRALMEECSSTCVSAPFYAIFDRPKWLSIIFRETGSGLVPAIWEVRMTDDKPTLAKPLRDGFVARFDYPHGSPDTRPAAEAGDVFSHGAGRTSSKGLIKDEKDPVIAEAIHAAIIRQIDRAYRYNLGG